MIIGLLIAIILYSCERTRKILEPYLVIINSLPKIALGPLIIVWVGAGRKAIVLMGFLICIIIEELRKILGNEYQIRRNGDDIFIKINGIDKKLSVSIATKSTTSGLIHTGLNIDPKGAPIEACGLTTDLGITDIETFAQNVMTRYIEENNEILEATCKVRGV